MGTNRYGLIKKKSVNKERIGIARRAPKIKTSIESATKIPLLDSKNNPTVKGRIVKIIR